MGFILTGTPAFATPILQVDGNGQLTGATGIDVAGTLFDVTFIDGACATIFNGCDAQSDFDFQTRAGATVAAQALLDQVFIDSPNISTWAFDSNPQYTAGCERIHVCNVLIPWFTRTDRIIYVAQASNNSHPALDWNSSDNPFYRTYDTSLSNQWTYAQFSTSSVAPTTTTPEPGTIILLSSGLLGLAGYRWQQRRREGSQVE